MGVTGSVRLADGSMREMALTELTSAPVLSAVPWGAIRSHRGQQHLPGAYWSSTTDGHVVSSPTRGSSLATDATRFAALANTGCVVRRYHGR